MTPENSVYIYRIGKPIHPALMHFSVACLIGALITDVTYWRTAEMMWANFSAWLLTAGLVLGVLAAIAALIDLVLGRLVGINRPTWVSVLGFIVALALSFLNALVHSRDAWTSVVPMGLGLSAIVVVILVASGWIGRVLLNRRYVGVVE